MNSSPALPHLGFGLGLRPKHYPYIFEHRPPVDWFEIISENFMDTDGRPKRNLARIREQYPIVMHGVSLSIGTVDPLNSEYLHKLKALMEWAQPVWISDHLCWTGVAHQNTHDLLPVPYTHEALEHIVSRLHLVQEFLGRPIAIENPSTYLEFTHSEIPEAEFIAQMAKRSGCHLLLDVNNVYVTCYNHRLDAKAYLDALPLDHVIQIHLSGHSNHGTHIIDTHDGHVVDPVWELYKYVVHRAGRTPNTMIEWDDHIPEFPVLYAELEKAKAAARDHENHHLPQLAQPQIPQRPNTPSTLGQSQTRMQEAIFLGTRNDVPPETWIRAKAEFPPVAQLKVYSNAYRYRLHDCVTEDFPVLRYYLGKEIFSNLLWNFIEDSPPGHFNIARYSLKLPAFTARTYPRNIFAQEIGLLEAALTEVADLPETTPLTQADLAGLTPEALLETRLHLRATLKLMQFSYPVNAYYGAVMEEQSPDKPRRTPSYLALFRHEDTVWRMDLEKAEYQLLKKLLSGKTIGQALQRLDESAASQLSEWFSRWIRNGLLAAPESRSITKEIHYAA